MPDDSNYRSRKASGVLQFRAKRRSSTLAALHAAEIRNLPYLGGVDIPYTAIIRRVRYAARRVVFPPNERAPR